jgi:hypothetical protein
LEAYAPQEIIHGDVVMPGNALPVEEYQHEDFGQKRQDGILRGR